MALGKNRDAFSLNCSCINTSPQDFCGLKRLDCSAGSGSWWVKLFFPGHCCFLSAGLRSEGSLKEPWGRNVCSQKRNWMVAVPFSWFVFMFLTWAVWYLCNGFSSPLSGCPLHSSVFGCLQLGFQCSAVGRPGRNFQQVVSNYLFSPFFFFFSMGSKWGILVARDLCHPVQNGNAWALRIGFGPCAVNAIHKLVLSIQPAALDTYLGLLSVLWVHKILSCINVCTNIKCLQMVTFWKTKSVGYGGEICSNSCRKSTALQLL